MSMKKVMVLGASGGMGYALTKELTANNYEVLAFARNQKKLDALFQSMPFVQCEAGDVLDVQRLSRLSKGIDVIFHVISVPYEQWEEKHPAIMQAVLQVAAMNECKVVVVDNVYAYGAQKGLVSEEIEKVPHTVKGKIRLHMEKLVKASTVPYLFVHLPDFYGPNASNTIVYHTIQSILANKTATFVGSLKIPREMIFTPDGAKAIVQLAKRPKAYYQNWNIPGERLVSGEELLQTIRQLTGYKKKVFTATKGMSRFLGIFSPMMREFVEMYYLYEQPFQLDGTKYEKEIGPLPKTPLLKGIQETIEYYSK